MARPIRVEFAGAVYHVMARGNERQAIFRDDTDRRLLRDALAEMVERFGVRLHAYCWMPNHYHLVLGTPRANLSRAMGWLQTTYSARFNARHRRSGHLFQGRFKAHLVDADEYARWLVEYVHLNPVRPRKRGEPIPPERAEELARFEWSSHRDYAGTRKKSPPWLCLDWLAYWGRSRRVAQAEYRKAIRRAFGQTLSNPWQQLRRGLVLGSEQLYQRARELMEQKAGLEEARWTEAEETAQVRERVRELIKADADERLKIWARVRVGGERGVDLAREYGYRAGAGVRQVVRRLESSANHDPKLKAKLEAIKKGAGRAQ
jgi:putative transposase